MPLDMNIVRCAALFASTVQRSEWPSARRLKDAIAQTVRRLGSRGCTAVVAQEFGDHPDAAVVRMRWARDQIDRLGAVAARAGPDPATLRIG